MVYYRQTKLNSCGAAAITYYKMTTGVLIVQNQVEYESAEDAVYSSIKFTKADQGYNEANQILGGILDEDYSNPYKMKSYLIDHSISLNCRFCIYQNDQFAAAAQKLGIVDFDKQDLTDINVITTGKYAIIIVLSGMALHYLLIRNNSGSLQMIDSADQNPDWKEYNLTSSSYGFTGAGILL